MKTSLLILALLIALCFGTEIRKLQDDFTVDTLFFTQCNCEDEVFRFKSSSFFPRPFVLEGKDAFSCVPGENELTDLPLSAGTRFTVDKEGGNTSLSADVSNTLFRKENGERGNFFFFIKFDIRFAVEDFTEVINIRLLDLPEENFFLDLVIDLYEHVSDGTYVRLSFSTHLGGKDNYLSTNFQNQFSYILFEQEGSFGERVLFFESKKRFLDESITGTGGKTGYIGVSDVPQQVVNGGTTPMNLFGTNGESGGKIDLDIKSISFGRNIVTPEELEEVIFDTGVFKFSSRRFRELEENSGPFLPNVVKDSFTVNAGERSLIHLNDLFEEDIGGLTFDFNFGGLLGEAEVFAEGILLYTSSDLVVEADTFILIVSADDSCGFDIPITIHVVQQQENDADGVGVAVVLTLLGVTTVLGIVGAVYYVRKNIQKSGDDEEDVVPKAKKKEESTSAVSHYV